MTSDSKKIEEIYAGKVAEEYDSSMPPLFTRWKKKAFDDSSLIRGNRVLVFCCGTGLDFPHILRKIGKEGGIVGVDFSSEMLNKANERISKNQWENILFLVYDKGGNIRDIDEFTHDFNINNDVKIRCIVIKH